MWLLLLVALLFPVGAEARPFNATEMRAVELAHDYWGKGPACEQIQYDALPPSVIGASGDAAQCLGGRTAYLAIRDDLPFITACSTITHEWGHLLLGYHHFGPAGSIMSEKPMPPALCIREDDRMTFRELKRKCKRKGRTRCIRRARRAAFG